MKKYNRETLKDIRQRNPLVKFGNLSSELYTWFYTEYDEDGEIVIDHVCTGTAISEGTYEYYIARPRIKNDLHGMGAFVLMCAEMERYFEEKHEKI